MNIMSPFAKAKNSADYAAAEAEIAEKIRAAKEAVEAAKKAVGAAAFDGGEDAAKSHLKDAEATLAALQEQIKVAEERKRSALAAEAQAALPKLWQRECDLLAQINAVALKISEQLSQLHAVKQDFNKHSRVLAHACPNQPRPSMPLAQLRAHQQQRWASMPSRNIGIAAENDEKIMDTFLRDCGAITIGRDYASTPLAKLLASVAELEFVPRK